jgi:hypothetical protein
MANEIDPKRLTKITADMIAAITSPAYVEAMNTLKKTPMEKRLAVATKLLTPDALRKKGVKLPEGMRISSRYFEPGKPAVIQVTDHGAFLATGIQGGDLGPMGAWGCACGGAATVCGGAGGGS